MYRRNHELACRFIRQQFNIRGYGNGTRGTRGVSSNFDGQGYGIPERHPGYRRGRYHHLDDIDYGSIGNVEIAKGPAGILIRAGHLPAP